MKVVQAHLEKEAGRVEFQMEGQTFVDVTEATANVENILNTVQDNWGDNYVLVTNDGLEIEDCSGTQGLKFWKSPRCKVFAVPKSDLSKKKTSNSAGVSIEIFSHHSKRRGKMS